MGDTGPTRGADARMVDLYWLRTPPSPDFEERLFKSRDITLPTKVRLVKAMVFTVVMYGCESWTVKKAEH